MMAAEQPIDIRSMMAERGFASEAPTVERKVYRSAQEIYETTPEDVPWCWHGYAAYGAVTLFAGRHKGGKSTLLFAAIGALACGETSFLGHAIDPGPVVLLTEEGDETLRPKLSGIGPDGRARIRVLGRRDVSPRGGYDWAQAVREAGEEAADWGARVVVIDTFAFWAQIKDENDNSLMQQVISVLGELASAGLAVIIVHHHRKSGGEDGDAIRGGTAIQGAVDIIVELIRPPSEGDEDEESAERELRSIGRFPEIPEALRVRWDGTSYRVIGEGTKAQVRKLTGEGRLLAIVRAAYPDTISAVDLRDEAAMSKTTAHRYLSDMERREVIESFQDGVGLPKRYRWVPE